jgi:hypothetical protein
VRQKAGSRTKKCGLRDWPRRVRLGADEEDEDDN